MTQQEFIDALQYLLTEGLIYPYDAEPGEFPGGSHNLNTQELWDAYGWNPPQYIVSADGSGELPEPDPNASLKPSWAEIEAAVPTSIFRATKSIRIQRVSIEETRRICEQYLGGQLRSDQSPTVQLEILYRLRAPNPELTLRDSERDRLHDVATSLLAALNAATTLEALIDPTDEAQWVDVTDSSD